MDQVLKCEDDICDKKLGTFWSPCKSAVTNTAFLNRFPNIIKLWTTLMNNHGLTFRSLHQTGISVGELGQKY